MTTSPHRTSPRFIVLTGATLLLGAWNVFGMPAESSAEVLSSEPAVDAVAIDGHGGSSATGSSGTTEAGAPRPDAAVQEGVVRVSTSTGPRTEGEVSQARPSLALGLLLDQVFGPERFQPAVPVQVATNPTEPAKPEVPASESAVLSAAKAGPAADASGAEPVVPDVEKAPDARARPMTEKLYFEEFRALATKDPQEFQRQADTVLTQEGDNSKKVALLRALYATDRQRSADYFVQAITTLPDVPVPNGASVPTFAVNFLCKPETDPALRELGERIAWGGYLNVSPELRAHAAESLLATATEEDLRRYAQYPGFRNTTPVTEGAP